MPAGVAIRGCLLQAFVAVLGGCSAGRATPTGGEDAGEVDTGSAMPDAEANDAGTTDLPSKAELDAWLEPVLADGYMHAFVVGFVDETGSAVHGYGIVGDGGAAPGGNTVFQVASITKTFTGLWLATQVVNGGVQLIDPVQQFLPNSVTVPMFGSNPITLQDLATHTSGLPDGLPPSFVPADPLNPWESFTVQDLYSFLDGYKLPYEPGSTFVYSDMGEGLLGLALSLRAGGTYDDGVQTWIAGPLGLVDTTSQLSASQEARFAPGHDGDLNSAEAWSWTEAQAGAGELQSTADDLLKYAAAQAGVTPTPLSGAIALSHRTYAQWDDLSVGLNWLTTAGGIVWHNGSTYGESSFIGFDPVAHKAVVLLVDTCTVGTPTQVASDLTTSIGLLLAQWLQGTTPVPLTTLLPKIAVLTQPQLQALVGSYVFPAFATPLAITLEEGRLKAESSWLWYYPVDLYPTSATSFDLRVLDGTLSFQADEDGGVGQAALSQQGQTFAGARQ